MDTPPLAPVSPVAEDRTVAILSYVTIVGFIVAIVMNGTKKTTLGSFHLRQALGLIVTAVAVWIPCLILTFIPFVNLLMILIWPVFGITMLVFVIMGLVAAANGQQKPLPLVGVRYQKWFAGAFV